jgi:hypothetical protein
MIDLMMLDLDLMMIDLMMLDLMIPRSNDARSTLREVVPKI